MTSGCTDTSIVISIK